jgi:DNA-binding response OmpR family regulator
MAGEKILLVDTEKNVLLMYQAILQEEGYAVDIAVTEQEAMEKIAAGNFSVMITELYLKNKVTTGLIKQVRQNYPDVYIIMITATSLSPESYEKIISAGVDDYFTKPFSPHALLANIKKGLRRRQVFMKSRELETRLRSIDDPSCTYDLISLKKKIKPVFNKSYFSTMLQHEMVRAKRYNHSFSLMTVDIKPKADRPEPSPAEQKQGITDALSRILMNTTRKTDIITIYNGTIALILVETPRVGAQVFQTRLQKEIDHTFSQTGSGNPQPLSSINIDFLSYPEQSQSIEEWMEGITRPL